MNALEVLPKESEESKEHSLKGKYGLEKFYFY